MISVVVQDVVVELQASVAAGVEWAAVRRVRARLFLVATLLGEPDDLVAAILLEPVRPSHTDYTIRRLGCT